ncbi:MULTISPECIES: hypothetical protein [Haloferax]|uniref:DUF7282 domain-containing protein n=1 Tax=Haloferax marinum TaxID=2666143 RepID=A0A6A8G6U5_9EURY|nr:MULTISPECIES: hypothetical protein [Haloferax]KAB1196972.1 hypothetical protein Hfx1150_05320 [Haloferax sp. CBA1150]MRW95993.1 hypothetical protein [Haloferax marinum]
MSYAVRAPSAMVAVLILTAALWVPTPTAAADQPTASFEQDVTTVTRGDIVEIRVRHSEPGVLHVGGDDYGYHLTVELTGAGVTTVTIDTYSSTGGPETYVSGGGNKTLHTAELQRPLEPTTYLMNVTIGGVERAIGQLQVEPRGNTSASTFVAPASLTDAESTPSVSAIRAASTKRTVVARGDIAVFRLDESGLESALASGNVSGGPDSNGVELSLNQLEVRPNHEQETFLATPENGATVVSDLENDAVYVLWDTSDLPLEGDRENYELAVTLQGEHNELVEADTITARTPVHLVEPSVSMAVDDETIYPWEPLTVNVTGETTLAPDTVLELRARAPGQPFLRLVPMTVTENGTLATNLTFAPEDRGLVFPMWIREYRDQTKTTMTFHESTAALRFVDQETDGTFVTISEVNLSVGGFIQVETPDEELLGTSAYLPPGRHENVVVEFDRRQLTDSELLAVAYADRNRDGNFSAEVDLPFRENSSVNGTVVADDAMVRLEPDAKTPTATPTPTRTPETDESPASEATATTTPYPVVERTPLDPAVAGTNTGIPFSPALAVVALVVTGLLVRLRKVGGDRR